MIVEAFNTQLPLSGSKKEIASKLEAELDQFRCVWGIHGREASLSPGVVSVMSSASQIQLNICPNETTDNLLWFCMTKCNQFHKATTMRSYNRTETSQKFFSWHQSAICILRIKNQNQIQ